MSYSTSNFLERQEAVTLQHAVGLTGSDTLEMRMRKSKNALFTSKLCAGEWGVHASSPARDLTSNTVKL